MFLFEICQWKNTTISCFFYEKKTNFILASSDGFCSGYKTSSFTTSCVAVAKDENSMERDYEY